MDSDSGHGKVKLMAAALADAILYTATSIKNYYNP
jgi:hypothetical protein